MTIAPQTPRHAFRTSEEAIDALRESGLRVSTARRLILEALFGAEGPVSATRLAERLTIDHTSVYRNLELLERHGLIRHVHLGHGPGLYAPVAENELEYLYCEGCAKVTPAAPEQLDPVREQISERFGYEARFTHFAIVGLCARCRERARSSPRGDGAEGLVEARRGHHYAGPEHAHERAGAHEHVHSHGDHIHSHPHEHSELAGRGEP